MLTTALCSTEQ